MTDPDPDTVWIRIVTLVRRALAEVCTVAMLLVQCCEYNFRCVQALQLQKEVELRRKELEYRFTAHAADAIDAVQRRKK